jgi:ABC-2 type transport system permease protein
MWYKLLASIKKEAIILLRDKIGLSILFIMPMVLVLVMTLVQDSAFKSINERGIPIIIVDNDHDTLGISVKQGLHYSKLCVVSDSINGQPATIEEAKKSVSEGKFLVGIIIPKGATAAIRKNVEQLVNASMPNDEDSLSKKTIQVTDSVNIVLYIDPVTKKSFLTSITSNLHEFISIVKTKIMFQTFSEQIAQLMPEKTSAPKNAFAQTQIINYKEIYASNIIGELVPNAVQHNVPAWTIFAMFFIVIPLAGSIMKEKNEGSVFRLHTMPSSYLLLINGKIIVYVCVCMLQFLLMMSVGLIFLPMLGLPALELGNSLFGIFIVTLATSFAATGYGVMVGTIASTEQQAAIVGSLSILLLSALGGLWVPTYIMPELMRHISVLSPLNWSLEGYYQLFLRGSDAYGILNESFKLIIFFFITMAIASTINRAKRNI